MPLIQPAFSVSGDYWETKADIPKNGIFSSAVVDGKIFVFGVPSGNPITYVYDPASDTWVSKAPMPNCQEVLPATVLEGKIHLVGRSLHGVYDPVSDSWETRTPMTTPRSEITANVVDGKIYVIGGRTDVEYSVAINEVYDPATDTWSTKKPLPTRATGYASAVFDGKIYIIGGRDENHNIPGFVQIYDPQTDSWRNGAPMPTPVWLGAAGITTSTSASKRIYVIGGLPDNSIDGSNLNQIYDLYNNAWANGTSMSTRRGWLTVASVDDKLYAIGGHLGFATSTYITKTEQYTPAADYNWLSPILTSTPSNSQTHSDNDPTLQTLLIAASLTIIALAVGIPVYLKSRKTNPKTI
jgi:N-acetylneuraminic acid mutarotase